MRRGGAERRRDQRPALAAVLRCGRSRARWPPPPAPGRAATRPGRRPPPPAPSAGRFQVRPPSTVRSSPADVASRYDFSETAATSFTRGWTSARPTSVGSRFQGRPRWARGTRRRRCRPAPSGPAGSSESTSRPSSPAPSRVPGPARHRARRTRRRAGGRPRCRPACGGARASNAMRETNRSEKPVVRGEASSRPVVRCAARPRRRRRAGRSPPGSASTALITRSLRVASRPVGAAVARDPEPLGGARVEQVGIVGALGEGARAPAAGGDAADLGPARRPRRSER